MENPNFMCEMHIAVDVMGGDQGCVVTLEAAACFLRNHQNVCLHLIGNSDQIELHGPSDLLKHDQVELIHTAEKVSMAAKPSRALRNGQNTSMWHALNLQAQGVCQATVSAGNTGALMVMSRYLLGMLPGIDRPAICSALPSANGKTYLLDLGANVDSSSEHLYQFAVMGNALVQKLEGIAKPELALLNIGVEDIKGNDSIKRASELLSHSELNYVGYVEADDVFLAPVDIVVCDGFAGNVALKSSEGMVRLMGKKLEEECKLSIIHRLAGKLGAPVLNRLRRNFDPRYYNGASLLGLKGNVVKSHGKTDVTAFVSALETALEEIRHDVPSQIKEEIANMLKQEE